MRDEFGQQQSQPQGAAGRRPDAAGRCGRIFLERSRSHTSSGLVCAAVLSRQGQIKAPWLAPQRQLCMRHTRCLTGRAYSTGERTARRRRHRATPLRLPPTRSANCPEGTCLSGARRSLSRAAASSDAIICISATTSKGYSRRPSRGERVCVIIARCCCVSPSGPPSPSSPLCTCSAASWLS